MLVEMVNDQEDNLHPIMLKKGSREELKRQEEETGNRISSTLIHLGTLLEVGGAVTCKTQEALQSEIAGADNKEAISNMYKLLHHRYSISSTN